MWQWSFPIGPLIWTQNVHLLVLDLAPCIAKGVKVLQADLVLESNCTATTLHF